VFLHLKMKKRTNKYLVVAILVGLVFHGTAMFFTLESTYDALIHLFFADHYANSWFEPWNFKWYTGFTVMSYPPLVHQSIALLSYIGGLKFGLFSLTLIAILLFITGIYRFSLLMTSSRNAAGHAAIIATLSSTFIETLHLFGQLPSIIGLSILCHALPEIYLWLTKGQKKHFFTAIALISVTVTSHHVTPIFGMVFFIFPLIGTAIISVAEKTTGSIKKVSFWLFLITFKTLLKRILSFCFTSLFIIIACLLPYWINSKNNPITQVPIPHGSRDNFLDVTSSGLVFFVIPWGILMFILPYVFYRYFSKKNICFGISIAMLTLLGTGGTTPLPKMILGANAFNILTLDRFTLWAAIMAIPMVGEFMYRFTEGDIKVLIQKKTNPIFHRLSGGVLALLFLFMAIFTISLGYFRPSQPAKIKILPIVNFLGQDHHDQWRYLTLGFGDQMAWLSSNTNALTVDGNYHSARRLPELTTRAVERLENSKFKGIEGLGSLQQFLTVPEKYNLKYIFSNDKFYDPMLYFLGWQRLRQLENGIMVWEKLNIPPIGKILPKVNVSIWQKIHWGTVPLLTVIFAFLVNIKSLVQRTLKTNTTNTQPNITYTTKHLWSLMVGLHFWAIFLIGCIVYGCYIFYIKNDTQRSPKNAVLAYYNALDFKRFTDAHQLLNPLSGVEMAQYMLQISVTDGLLSSYAKMDAIKVDITNLTDTTATAKVNTKFITALKEIKDSTYHNLVKIDQKWYINPKKTNKDLPPDQLYTESIPKFYNQGRRRITTEQTYYEDVLKQPVLQILDAKLIKEKDQYSIIGSVQNIDNVPADIVLSGTLYNNQDKALATYSAKDDIKHKLMPKEVSAFKIYFEGIAWLKATEKGPKTFNPRAFTPVELEDIPTQFDLHAAGNVSGSDLYKKTTLNCLQVNNNRLFGTFYNSGIAEATIPQIIVSYYNADKQLINVDHKYLLEGIRQQRKLNFNYTLKAQQIKIISDKMNNCFVNGLPNPDELQKDIIQNLIPTNQQNSQYIKLEINTYTGIPY